MAKRRSGLRDNSIISNPGLHAPRILTPRPPRTWSQNLRLVEDRRSYHPEALTQMRPVRMINSQRPRLIPVAFSSPKYKFNNLVPTAIGFKIPNKVAICVRRKQRKEILHALKKTGRGKRTSRGRRSQWSDIHC